MDFEGRRSGEEVEHRAGFDLPGQDALRQQVGERLGGFEGEGYGGQDQCGAVPQLLDLVDLLLALGDLDVTLSAAARTRWRARQRKG